MRTARDRSPRPGERMQELEDPQDQKGTSDQEGRPKGGRAILGAAIAILGALATVHPTSRLLQAISEAVPQLAVALPPVITAVGAILAAVSEPPEMRKGK